MSYEDQAQNVQIAPAMEMHVSKNGIYVAAQGSETESLSDVCNCVHNEIRWAWDRDSMAVIEDDRPRIIQPR